MRWKIGLLVGIAVGYVLGTRAGRESYERLVSKGQEFLHSQPVEEARAGMSATMDEAGAHAAEFVRQATPGGGS